MGKKVECWVVLLLKAQSRKLWIPCPSSIIVVISFTRALCSSPPLGIPFVERKPDQLPSVSQSASELEALV